MKRLTLALALLALPAAAQDLSKTIETNERRAQRTAEDVQRQTDDVLWYFKLGDVANIDKFEIASSKPRREKNPTDLNAGNMLIIPVYVFSPKNLRGKAPMLVFAHGGVHGRLTSNYAHIFREALEQGFVVVSLLVHTTTNDEDVNVLEVEHLIAALKADGKQFEYKIYQNAPGAHRFNRIDTALAKESRREMWAFLARHLK